MLILIFINFIIMKLIQLTFSRTDFFVNFTTFNTHCFMFIATINHENHNQYFILIYFDMISSMKQYVRAVNTFMTILKLRMYIINFAQNLVVVSETK